MPLNDDPKVVELNELIKSLESDIAELQKQKSELTSYLEQEVKQYRASLEAEYMAKNSKLDRESDKKEKAQVEKQKYLDDYLFRLDKREQEIAAKGIEIEDKRKALEDDVARMNKEKEIVLTNVLSREAAVSRQSLEVDAKIRDIVVRETALLGKSAELDNRDFNITEREKSIDGDLEDVDARRKENAATLAQIMEKEKALEDKRAVITKMLEDIKAENNKLSDLSAMHEEYKKFLDEKKVFEEQRAMWLKESLRVEKLSNDTKERELSVTERERLLTIKNMELDKKISVLNELRAKTNVA